MPTQNPDLDYTLTVTSLETGRYVVFDMYGHMMWTTSRRTKGLQQEERMILLGMLSRFTGETLEYQHSGEGKLYTLEEVQYE